MTHALGRVETRRGGRARRGRRGSGPAGRDGVRRPELRAGVAGVAGSRVRGALRAGGRRRAGGAAEREGVAAAARCERSSGAFSGGC